jgi:hypothetical protein
MEAEIAHKREELQKLQAEQEVLRSRQQALESTMSNQDQLLAQLLQVGRCVAGCCCCCCCCCLGTHNT